MKWKKSLNMQSISPANMKLSFGNMGSISFEHEMHCLNLWIFESWQLWNFQALERRNQETKKPNNHETCKFCVFPMKGDPSPQHADSHTCTSSSLGAHTSHYNNYSGVISSRPMLAMLANVPDALALNQKWVPNFKSCTTTQHLSGTLNLERSLSRFRFDLSLERFRNHFTLR